MKRVNRNRPYKKEELDFIKIMKTKHDITTVTTLFNQTFDVKRSKCSIQSAVTRYKLQTKKDAQLTIDDQYTVPQLEFIRDVYFYKDLETTCKWYNSMYHEDLTIDKLKEIITVKNFPKETEYKNLLQNFTNKQLTFIEKTYATCDVEQTTQKFNEYFKTNLSTQKIQYVIIQSGFQQIEYKQIRYTKKFFPDEWNEILKLTLLPEKDWDEHHHRRMKELRKTFKIE